MGNNLELYKTDLSKLLSMGSKMHLDLAAQSKKQNGEDLQELFDGDVEKGFKLVDGRFQNDYQRWYTESFAVIKQLIPQRVEEFKELYQGGPRRKEINAMTYTIQDWLTGIRSGTNYLGEKIFNDLNSVFMKFQTQLQILNAAESRFDSTLHDMRQIVQADLFDTELDAGRELLKSGFLRAAGAIAGVVLEKHLAEVCANRSIKIGKKNPNISDFYDPLKADGVIDVPTWRFIQRLGDLRNLCDHNKDREPTEDEVSELLAGVDKTSKTVF